MVDTTLITVNGKPFIGRVEEQKQFRAALKDVLYPPKDEVLPYVFLLYGDGGIGKTTLARRYRDIACHEKPYAGEVSVLWVDWEEERGRSASLQVGREHISPETVFDVLYTAAQRAGHEKHFAAYRKTLEDRKKAEKKAAQALASGEGRDEFAAWRSPLAAGTSKLLRLWKPGIGQTGEDLSKAFLEIGIKVGAEQAHALYTSLDNRLRAHLGVQQYELYVHPHEGLARALADGLKRLAGRSALMVVLDTYEIVDRADVFLRLAIQAAGPRMLWVISGRTNLRDSRQFGQGYLKGYAEDLPRRLVAYDMGQLALADVKAYFAARVPGRPLDKATAEAIRRATRGIPLAMAEAAEMWERGVSLEDIGGDTTDATPGREIVAKMTERYLLHATAPEDKCALLALTLARGDLEVLRAMLRPDDGTPFDLPALLRCLERDYASVYAGEQRLHDEPQAFFVEYLKVPQQRTSDEVRGLLTRGDAALRSRLQRIQSTCVLIQERHEDEDWLRGSLDLAEMLFWMDEEAAWRWLVPRFVESLAYSRDLRRGLMEIAGRWEKTLSARGKKRLRALKAAEDWGPAGEEEGEMIRELSRTFPLGWMDGEGETERRAILDWWRGMRLAAQKRYPEALATYEQAERGLPEGGQTLREHLGEALYGLADSLMWPERAQSAVYSSEAERILPKVVSWLPDKQNAWYRLGTIHALAGRHDEAIAAFKKAIELDPKNAYPWNGLGNVYDDLGRHDEAIAAYNKAIELDPKFAAPWNGLGNVYTLQGQHDQALEAFRKAVELAPDRGIYRSSLVGILRRMGQEAEAAEQEALARPLIAKESEYNQACFHAICGNKEEALRLLAVAMEKRQASPAWARRDPDFALLHDDPRFWAIVGQPAGDEG